MYHIFSSIFGRNPVSSILRNNSKFLKVLVRLKNCGLKAWLMGTILLSFFESLFIPNFPLFKGGGVLFISSVVSHSTS